VRNELNPKIGKLAIDGAIILVFALMILLYAFLLLGEFGLALTVFLIALAISLGARLVVEKRRVR
jgi:hypothetical protein